MSLNAPPIDYARDPLEQPADRLLRRIIGVLAIAHGAMGLTTNALHVLLARGWTTSPTTMSWSIDSTWQAGIMVATALVMIALLSGGVMVMRGSAAGFSMLRIGATAEILISGIGLALVLGNNSIYRSYWSTPATGVIYAIQFVEGEWVPLLMLALTLPPLARRMVMVRT
jgi:hypothetical protein